MFTAYGLVLRSLQSPSSTQRHLYPPSSLESQLAPLQPPIPTLTQVTFAGAGSGVLSSFVRISGSDASMLQHVAVADAGITVFCPYWLFRIVTTPIDRLKILQQAAPAGRPQPALGELVRRLGVAGCYRGWAVTALRDVGYGSVSRPGERVRLQYSRC